MKVCILAGKRRHVECVCWGVPAILPQEAQCVLQELSGTGWNACCSGLEQGRHVTVRRFLNRYTTSAWESRVAQTFHLVHRLLPRNLGVDRAVRLALLG